MGCALQQVQLERCERQYQRQRHNLAKQRRHDLAEQRGDDFAEQRREQQRLDRQQRKQHRHDAVIPRRLAAYSHSMVAGGLEEMS